LPREAKTECRRSCPARWSAPIRRPFSAPQPRLYYLDYLRAGIVALVMLHHTAITYGGGAGSGWYYLGRTGSGLTDAALTMFVSFNQAWFMAFLFFLSGFFSPPSLMRKGPGPYVADRLRRFGIPLVVAS
jgi:peptidoglycan/LPS O-acetylase OafA/YrhL